MVDSTTFSHSCAQRIQFVVQAPRQVAIDLISYDNRVWSEASVIMLYLLQYILLFLSSRQFLTEKKPSKMSQRQLENTETLSKSAVQYQQSLSGTETLYIVCLVLIQLYCLLIHGLFGFMKHFEFLPLLLTSVSCALGVVWTWVKFYVEVLFN